MVIVGYTSWQIKDMEFFGLDDAINHIEAQGAKNIPGTNQWEYPSGVKAYLKKVLKNLVVSMKIGALHRVFYNVEYCMQSYLQRKHKLK